MSYSEDLARFIGGLTYDELPPNVVDASKRLLIDTIGVGIGGTKSEEWRPLEGLLRDLGGPEEATVLGTRLRTSRLQAALGNAVLMHALNMEDTLDQAMVHTGPGTIGASLALVEHQGCTGKELITAIAVGYEVNVRIASAVYPSLSTRGFHPSGTCASFGATAAAAKLMGLTESQIAAALGLAGLQAAGLRQGADPFAPFLMSFNAGRAAHLGMTSALLARHGYPGSLQIFEAPYGFCATHTDSFDPTLITNGLGTEYLMPKVGIKLYPSGRPTQATIASVAHLKQLHNIDPEAVAEVVVKRGFPAEMDVENRPNPQTQFEAQVSLQYMVTVVLTTGNYALEDLRAQALEDPAFRRLMAKVKVTADPELEEERVRDPSKWPTVVDVHMNDGTTRSHKMDFAPGSSLDSVTPQQLSDKYRSLVAGVLPERQAQELWSMVERLETASGLAQFYRLWEAPP